MKSFGTKCNGHTMTAWLLQNTTSQMLTKIKHDISHTERSASRCECFISSFQLYGGTAETQGNAGHHVRQQYSKFLCKGSPDIKTM